LSAAASNAAPGAKAMPMIKAKIGITYSFDADICNFSERYSAFATKSSGSGSKVGGYARFAV
jgi:hypothetical protein